MHWSLGSVQLSHLRHLPPTAFLWTMHSLLDCKKRNLGMDPVAPAPQPLCTLTQSTCQRKTEKPIDWLITFVYIVVILPTWFTIVLPNHLLPSPSRLLQSITSPFLLLHRFFSPPPTALSSFFSVATHGQFFSFFLFFFLSYGLHLCPSILSTPQAQKH